MDLPLPKASRKVKRSRALFEFGTRILGVNHGRDARATFVWCVSCGFVDSGLQTKIHPLSHTKPHEEPKGKAA